MPINTDLRKKLPTPVPEDQEKRTLNMPGFSGTLPLKPGKIVNGRVALTDQERELLQQAGVKLHADTGNADRDANVIAERTRITEEGKFVLPANPNTPPLKLPKEIDISELPLAQQQQIFKSIEEAQKKLEATPLGHLTNPSLSDLITQSKKYADKSVTVEEEKVEIKSEAGSVGVSTNCSHCGWPSNVEDVTATTEDKYNFIQSVLGQIRFKKTYRLLDDRLRVTFRSITSFEADLIFRQLSLELKNGKLETTTQYYENMLTYNLICSLDKIESDQTGVIECPEIKDYKVDVNNENTCLVSIAPIVLETALPINSTRRSIIVQMARFTRLLEHLEARIDDEGFWKATEEPR